MKKFIYGAVSPERPLPPKKPQVEYNEPSKPKPPEDTPHNVRYTSDIPKPPKEPADQFKVEEYDANQHYQYMKNMISGLVGLELRDANQHYPLFASNHEAHGVILEELQETGEDLEAVKEHVENLWAHVRVNKEYSIGFAKMKCHAMNAAYEAIQLAAMCQKAIDSERERTK